MRYFLICAALLPSFALAGKCPSERELAKQVLEALVSGATLSTETCVLPKSTVKITRPFDDSLSRVTEACESEPFKVLDVVKRESEVFEVQFQHNVLGSDKKCSLKPKETLVFRRYSGEMLKFAESCAGILSLPKETVLRKECLPNKAVR